MASIADADEPAGQLAAAAKPPSRFRRICVFGGSQSGKKTTYREAAAELGEELVKGGIDLVYGGGSIGLVGLLSSVVHHGGGHVLGFIPKSLISKEVTSASIGEVRTVSDMHEQKAEMSRHADVFIALPGGYETMEGLLEVITWAQLGIHKKPVGLLNVDGFYNALLSFIDIAVEEGFISQEARRIIISAPTARELFRKLEEYVPEYETPLVWDSEKPVQNIVPEPESGVAL